MKKKKPAPGKMAVVSAMVFAKEPEEKAATLRRRAEKKHGTAPKAKKKSAPGFNVAGRRQAKADREKYRAGLEQLVKQRTSELEAVNAMLETELAERIKVQESLRESEDRFRQLTDASFEGLLIHAEGRILDANSRAGSLLGYDPAEQIGRPFLDFIDSKYHGLVLENIRNDFGGAYELKLIHSNGGRVSVEVMARPIMWKGRPARVVAIRDITERRRAEATLRENETLLRDVINALADPLYVKDTESRLSLVNPATVALLGKPIEQIVGRTDRELYEDPAIGESILAHDRKVMRSGAVEVFEETIQTRTGNRVMLNTKAPRRDAAGNIIGLVGVARDITDYKHAIEETRKRAEELKAANEELTRFNSIMVDRELRIIELKKQVNELCVKAGLPARYKTDFEDEVDGIPDPGKQV